MTTFNPVYTHPNKEREDRDLIMLARGMVAIDYCPGGRANVKGYVCIHCGVDYTDGTGFCGQPLEEDGYTPFDATVARRILRDSEGRFEEQG